MGQDNERILGFQDSSNITDTQVVAPLLAYIQYLADQGLSFGTIRNYVSALKSYLIRLNQPVHNFEHSVFKALWNHWLTRNPLG